MDDYLNMIKELPEGVPNYPGKESQHMGIDVQKLDVRFDIDKLKEALNFILTQADIDRMDQIGLTHIAGLYKDKWHQSCGSLIYDYRSVNGDPNNRTKVKKSYVATENDFPEIIEEIKSTYFYNVYKTLSTEFKIGRMRIMRMKPWTCLTWHHDSSKRLHIPIISNPGNRLVINTTCHQLIADGSVYLVDTTQDHSAFNGGLEDRYNLLITLRE